jgi:hypothetical protein
MALQAVFYLSRWGNHPRWSQAFLKGVAAYNAGADFDLVYILKGFPEGVTDPALVEYRSSIARNITEVRVSDESYATNVFLDVAAQVDYERILFLISYSRILAAGWVAAYLRAFDSVPNCGTVGATGGYETIPGTTFPNVNVRTNAFMISRKLLLDLDHGPLSTKRDGQRLEAGPTSITRQVSQKNLVPVLVDRFGKVWQVDDWPESRTFRSGNQEGLLIADNRTHDYEVAGYRKRLKLATLNWGARAVVPHTSIAYRIEREIAWRWPRARSY